MAVKSGVPKYNSFLFAIMATAFDGLVDFNEVDGFDQVNAFARVFAVDADGESSTSTSGIIKSRSST